jgi:hypothetical protein
MADLKTTDEAAAAALDGSELWRIVQAAVSKKMTVAQLKTYLDTLYPAKVLIEQYPHGLVVKGATHDRFFGSAIVQQSPSTGTSGLNQLRASPFLVTKSLSLDTIQAEVTTFVGGANFRLGIYADEGSCYPGALLLDTGNLSGAANAVVSFTITPSLVLPPGLYWLAIVADASITFRAPNAVASGFPNLLGRNSSMGINWRHQFYFLTYTYAALPDPFSAGATINTAANQIAEILVRAV